MSRLLVNYDEKGEKYINELQKNIDKLINTYFEQRLSPVNSELE